MQSHVNGVMSLMTLTVAPDVTTSSLSITNSQSQNPGIWMTQFGGGFTWSRETPLYLEGNAAYSRYDPVFVASDGTEQRVLPARWNTVTATGGIGWDFPISEHWVVRPIFNFTLGYVASDLRVAKFFVESNTELDLDFIDGGRLNAYGLGGSLMLDYESFSPEQDLDLEIRYTDVELRSYGSSNEAVQGSASAQSVGLWARRRAPTGMTALQRPVRYVLEYAHTRFLGPDAGVLGFNQLNSVGAGFELDSSAYDVWATRWRAVLRYKFGPNVTGWSLGLALSF
nr:autotransporter domain-containing protein [Rivibacter subsaxonicus]